MNNYRNSIRSILNDIQKSIDQKLSDLEKLNRQKPVCAEWYLAKAKLLFEKEQTPENVYHLLNNTFFLREPIDIVPEIQDFLGVLDSSWGDSALAGYRHFEKNCVFGDEEAVAKAMEKLWQSEGQTLETWDDFASLADAYLACNKLLNYHILRKYAVSVGQDVILRRPWIEEQPNMGFIDESIEKKKRFVIVVGALDQIKETLVMGRCLAGMGCPVYILNVPGQIDVDAPIATDMTVPVSMENAEEEYGILQIPLVELLFHGESLGDNCADVIDSLCQEESIVVLASNIKFEELYQKTSIKNRVESLYDYGMNLRGEYFSFGWAGSYLNYINDLYNMDTKEAVYRKPECRFSVVIPVRNSAETLRHTLKTCLNQRYQGDYEIIISDNSTEGNTEVYQFCRTITDKRVKYCRTPRDLRLSKSFEYAFLQTRGEYIFSMGADDVMLPWALEAWDGVIKEFPEEEIFLWDRGFYAWPGFNKGQQHQFVIPGKYEKHNIELEYIDPMEYLFVAMKKPSLMYILPMLYINSGFKREFMQTLLKETGRLWDGICQDIYMGVIVSALKKRILKISYPFTMAGMSEGSAGALANRPVESQETGTVGLERQIKENNVGGFSKSEIECLMPELGTDVTSLYNSILRAVNRGVISQRYLENAVDWKQWFLNTYQVMDKRDIYFDKKICQMRFAARKQGDDFLKWFDETIYQKAMESVIFSEEESNERAYQEVDDDEFRMLDASKYGVQNSYDASLLFEKLTGL